MQTQDCSDGARSTGPFVGDFGLCCAKLVLLESAAVVLSDFERCENAPNTMSYERPKCPTHSI